MDLTKLLRLIRNSDRLFVLTGAGCSTASGIPDYRDLSGEWKRKPPTQYKEFTKSDQARRRYWARSLIGWRWFSKANTNETHQALARMERLGHVFQLVTQNVDGLHQKAGSRAVIDLHGRLDRVVCIDCRFTYSRQSIQHRLESHNQAYANLVGHISPDGDAELDEINFDQFKVPNCEQCGGVLKPDVVFFGEAVPGETVKQAYAMVSQADALLVVGSSLMVYSGYRFCRAALEQKKPVAIINQGRTRIDDQSVLKFEADCGRVLGTLVDELESVVAA